MLNWIGDNTFTLGDINFTLDISPGYQRRPSQERDFTLVKNKSYLRDYLKLATEDYDHVIELGVFQGGSMVLFDKLFSPKKIVGVELASTPIDALDTYISTEAPHMQVYYNSSQDNEALLRRIVKDDFDGQLDLVVDDASHLYEQTRKSLEVLFPLLKPGGTYVIEDWAWSHRPNAQVKGHPWRKKPSMTNLIYQLVAELGSSNEIESLYINNNLVIIKKSPQASSSDLLDALALRGKKMKLI